jgi:8-oxo-dGTP diphosphatase
MLQVVAAIIERDGRILIGRRQAHQSHALQWEFPGGKVENGESPQEALARELQEELSIADAVGEEILRYEYAYPGKPGIELIFFRVTSYRGEIREVIYSETAWAARPELALYDFVAGDRRFVEQFASAG